MRENHLQQNRRGQNGLPMKQLKSLCMQLFFRKNDEEYQNSPISDNLGNMQVKYEFIKESLKRNRKNFYSEKEQRKYLTKIVH